MTSIQPGSTGPADRARSDEADLVWCPGPAELARSRAERFRVHAGASDPAGLNDIARDDPAAFWATVTAWLGFSWQRKADAVLDQLAEPHTTRWFPGGRFNLADNAVRRWVREGRGDDVALVSEDESGERTSHTFIELSELVDRVARGLRAVGVEPGDRVGMQLGMTVEAVAVQLGCALIGAVLVPVFSGFGSGAVAERLRLSGAVVHIVSGVTVRRGRTLSLRQRTADALEAAHSVRTTVVVGDLDDTASPRLRGEISWQQLITPEGPAGPVEAAELPADHPLLIAYTSGTTGAPKGVVLSQAGFAVKAAFDAAFCFDIGPGDLACWITDPGWIMCPITVLGGLLAGSAVGVYSGSVDHPDAGRLWRVVHGLGITMLGVSPTMVRILAAADPDLAAPELGRLRVFASSGEPWTPDAYAWLFATIGCREIPIINYSGGTEVSGAILSNTTSQPIHPCGFAGPLPGMAAEIADEQGHPVHHGVGELVLRTPSPGMPTTFWAEPERYRRTYWDRWPGTWVHGDSVEVSGPEAVWYIRGRSDDTLKVAGKRVGPAEVEGIANSLDVVLESAAVGVPDDVKGEAIAVFLRLAPGTAEEPVRTAVRGRIVDNLGKPLKPKAVLVVDQLPRTRSGKIMRRVVRAVYLGQEVTNVSALENADALESIREAR
ncbi:AMP-binding protein [Sciscionella marina]|uniref:AMP-binding protein n=1 Tax=Sciscionella marina TaxID=508770 RepID=UPI0003A14157|nr:AMP-binding protein [Sciscionella marina]